MIAGDLLLVFAGVPFGSPGFFLACRHLLGQVSAKTVATGDCASSACVLGIASSEVVFRD